MTLPELFDVIIENLSHLPQMNSEERKNSMKNLVFKFPVEYENQIVSERDIWDKKIDNISDPYGKLFFLSMMSELTGDGVYLEKMTDVARRSDLNVYEKQYVLSRVGGRIFINERYDTMRLSHKLDDLYRDIYQWYVNTINVDLYRIPVLKRNKNLILVMTGQLLGLHHGPTKTVLDRCRILIRDLGKDILLINYGGVNPSDHVIPFYFSNKTGSHIESLDNVDRINYEDVTIPYVQMKHEYPRVETIAGLIELVREYKPYQIVATHSSSILDILDRLIPVLNISLCFSKLVQTYCSYQQIGRPINAEDMEILQYRGMQEDSVISDVFTFKLKPQEKSCSRQELDLPDEGKIIVLVGARLNEEINDELIDLMIELINSHQVYFLLLGTADKTVKCIIEKDENVKDHVLAPGLVDDVLSYMDHCSIYINPLRRGGGGSAVEAMYKCVVPVTFAFGDVYVNTADDFAVDGYDQMRTMIDDLLNDEMYYAEMSAKARRRATVCMDSSTAFLRVMGEYERRMIEAENNGRLL